MAKTGSPNEDGSPSDENAVTPPSSKAPDVIPEPPPSTASRRGGTAQSGGKRGSAIPAALLALMSAILGGAITAGASVFVANRTIEAQAKQSVAEYQRTNREQIYTEVLAQLTRIDGLTEKATVNRILGDLGTSPGSPPADPNRFNEYKPLFEEWQPEFDKLNVAISNAELVSSRRVIDICKALSDAYWFEFYNTLADELTADMQPDLRRKMLDSIKQTGSPYVYDPTLKDRSIGELREMFIKEAKNDLAFND